MRWRHYGVTTSVQVLAVAAAVGGVLGAAAPQLLKWIYVGWMVAARWSSTGAGSCSSTVTDTPRLLSASAHTMPTGPAPTMMQSSVSIGRQHLARRSVPLPAKDEPCIYGMCIRRWR